MVTQAWSIAELSISRWNITAVTLGNKIFFAGGHTNFQDSWRLFSNVDIYNASTNTWSTAQLSERRMDLDAATSGNKIFFAGGVGGGFLPSFVSNKVDVYDNNVDAWSTITLGEARSCLKAVPAGDKIYFAGGNTISRSYGYSCSPSNRVDVYDNTSGTWSISKMNEALAFRADIVAGNKIFWAGGWNVTCNNSDPTLSSGVEIRDVNTQTSSYACLFQPNAQFKAVAKNNKIVFFTGQGAVKNKFDIYDVAGNTWSIGTLPLDFQNVATAIISVDNTIYVAEWGQVWKLDF